MMMRIGLLGLILIFSYPVQATVSKFQLDNGMKVLVKEDHRAPVAVQQVWYRVGSNYEYGGISGLSHMLEHMMFKGTQKLAPGEFSKIVSKLGGQDNAFTSSDYTAYYQVVGKQHLEKVMELEADRMRNVVITDAEFQKERDVVTEERRWRTEDQPESKLYELFKATAFVNSPQHHPVIGWMTDIRHWTLEDVRHWYQKWYAPNNATLVVVGDVNPQQVYKWAQKYYGVHQAEKITPPKPRTEIEQVGERRIQMKGPTKSPSVMMGFHVPSLVTTDDPAEVYALSVLGSVLDGDDSARLTKDLVRGSKIVAGASTSYDETSRLETLFRFDATPSAGKTLEEVEAALWKEIDKLKSTPISQKELERVLAHAEAQYVFHQDSIQTQAMILGSLVSVGLPTDTYENWIENLRKVTPEQVQKVAQKYLKRDAVTVATLLPNGEEAKPSSGQMMHGGIR